MWDFTYLKSILLGAVVTIEISLLSLLISTMLGLFFALFRVSKVTLLRRSAAVYVTVIRGIPDLVLMLLFFFGGQILINTIALQFNHTDYIDISPFIAGVATIGFIYGAYMTETFRGAILALDKGQIEAAESLGLSPRRILFKIMLPQITLHALPGFSNNWLVLVKSTALVSLIGLNDMVGVAEYASSATKNPFFYYLLVSFIYLGFSSLTLYLLNLFTKKYHLEHQN